MSDSVVASVEFTAKGAFIKGLSAGKTVVTAASIYDETKKAEINVTVLPPKYVLDDKWTVKNSDAKYIFSSGSNWRHHPDALLCEDDEGCFNGGGFVDDDKTAYLSFWKFRSRSEGGDNGGIAIAYARPPYDHWERIKPIAIEGSREKWGTADIQIDGKVEHIACADPSNIWKADGWYYMQTHGNQVSWGEKLFEKSFSPIPPFQKLLIK